MCCSGICKAPAPNWAHKLSLTNEMVGALILIYIEWATSVCFAQSWTFRPCSAFAPLAWAALGQPG